VFVVGAVFVVAADHGGNNFGPAYGDWLYAAVQLSCGNAGQEASHTSHCASCGLEPRAIPYAKTFFATASALS
jgi:hypothetical protein